jgi:hypothetical protein
MGREANVEIGMNVPDFVGNKDVYDALDKSVKSLEESHIEVHDIAVTGLITDEGDSSGS